MVGKAVYNERSAGRRAVIARVLVTSLLLCVIMAGLGLSFPLDTVSGVATSTSTVTSTSYSYKHETSYSTSFVRQMVTTEPSYFQEEMDGPYLKIEGRWWVEGYSLGVSMYLTNLMNVPIVRGFLGIGIRTTSGRGDAVLLNFTSIAPGKTYNLHQRTSPRETYGMPILTAYFMGVRAYCEAQTVTTYAPIATYTYVETRTDTYLRTWITELTIAEVPSLATSPFLLLALILGVVVFLIAYRLIPARGKRPSELQVKAFERRCGRCGTVLDTGEDFCPNCGEKWE